MSAYPRWHVAACVSIGSAVEGVGTQATLVAVSAAGSEGQRSITAVAWNDRVFLYDTRTSRPYHPPRYNDFVAVHAAGAQPAFSQPDATPSEAEDEERAVLQPLAQPDQTFSIPVPRVSHICWAGEHGVLAAVFGHDTVYVALFDCVTGSPYPFWRRALPRNTRPTALAAWPGAALLLVAFADGHLEAHSPLQHRAVALSPPRALRFPSTAVSVGPQGEWAAFMWDRGFSAFCFSAREPRRFHWFGKVDLVEQLLTLQDPGSSPPARVYRPLCRERDVVRFVPVALCTPARVADAEDAALCRPQLAPDGRAVLFLFRGAVNASVADSRAVNVWALPTQAFAGAPALLDVTDRCVAGSMVTRATQTTQLSCVPMQLALRSYKV